MKHARKLIILVLCVVIVSAAAFVVLRGREAKHGVKHDGKYTYVYGTVTDYDTGPAAYDGAIIFKIDGIAVDIGGGFRFSKDIGEVYTPIRVGDKVQAKAINSQYGNRLTVFDCRDCYVKKQSLFD